MTVIVQDDHLTAGAWAACAVTRQKQGGESIFKDIAAKKKKKKKTLEKNFIRKLMRQASKNWKSYMLLLKNKKRKIK